MTANCNLFHSTRAEPYKVIINTLKGLPRTKLDAAWGLTGLFSLYAIRFACDWATKKWPRRRKLYPSTNCLHGVPHSFPILGQVFFFISVFRNAFVLIILTLASFLYCRHRKSSSGKYPIKILQNVPRGFQHVGAPVIDGDLLSALASEIPVATIILLLEHIAISKCMYQCFFSPVTLDPDELPLFQHLAALMATKSTPTRSSSPSVSPISSVPALRLIPPLVLSRVPL